MYTFSIKKHELKFLRPAKTSRNVFATRMIYLIELIDSVSKKSGVGESAPLSLLSIDDVEDYEKVLHSKVSEFCELGCLHDLDLTMFPSIRFGIETALRSLEQDERGRMYQTAFANGKSAIDVNGLVWMSDVDTMYEEALKKAEAGYSVLKFKVGALDFDAECRMIEKIRRRYSAFKLTIRLDVNGGFLATEALEQLAELSRFEIHSIEQPIATKQWDDIQKLCAESKIDIALDEELIGVDVAKEGGELMKYIRPQYLILKPNLIGGVSIADEWISLANKYGAGWWATSALESNVGLNAIAQWVSTYDPKVPQGLGTGSLFSNNLPTKLSLKNGKMWFVQ